MHSSVHSDGAAAAESCINWLCHLANKIFPIEYLRLIDDMMNRSSEDANVRTDGRTHRHQSAFIGTHNDKYTKIII